MGELPEIKSICEMRGILIQLHGVGRPTACDSLLLPPD
jgi:hypothetical protein